MKEYLVKIKDRQQDTTHTVHQLATSQNEANYIVIRQLKRMLGHDNLEIA